jgi:hypothetical protein
MSDELFNSRFISASFTVHSCVKLVIGGLDMLAHLQRSFSASGLGLKTTALNVKTTVVSLLSLYPRTGGIEILGHLE